MNRAELEARAYEILRQDMAYIGITDTELTEAIKNASDETLTGYVEEAE